MSSFQQTIVMGYVGSDPKMTHFEGGGIIAQLSIATTDKWKDKVTGEQRERTNWHSCIFRNKQAEVIEKFVNKGSLLMVTGKNVTRKWSDKSGNERYTTEVVCSQFTFVPKGRGVAQGSAVESYNESKEKGSEGGVSSMEESDDLPF